jgi:hypothetical protein
MTKVCAFQTHDVQSTRRDQHLPEKPPKKTPSKPRLSHETRPSSHGIALAHLRVVLTVMKMEPELLEKRPCNCGAMVLHLRISDKDYWRCERDPAICGAIGKTYEDALQTQLLLFQDTGTSRLLH